MEVLHRKLVWFALAVLWTLWAATMYIGVQQALRLGANEPQASMTNAAATQLENGGRPDSVVSGRIDMANNMAPFVIVYDKFGKVVKGNGYLDGNVPQVPVGVLNASDGKANKVTWQPNGDVRIAAVSVKAGDNYVLGGRNLKVVEHNIDKFTRWLVVAWLVGLLVLAIAYRLFNRSLNPVVHSPKG